MCPYYEICAKKLEDLPDFDPDDPCCFGRGPNDWAGCIVYLDLKNDVLRKHTIEMLEGSPS